MLSYLNQLFQKAEEHSHYPESEEKIFSDKIYLGKSFGKSSFEKANCQYFGNFFIDSSKFSSKNFEKEIAGLIHQLLKTYTSSSIIFDKDNRIDYRRQMELLGLKFIQDTPDWSTECSENEYIGIARTPYDAVDDSKMEEDAFVKFSQFLAYTRIMPKAWVRLIFSTLNNRNAREFINLINDIILEIEDNEFLILAKDKNSKNITKQDLPSFSNYKTLRDAMGILRSKKNKNKLASALELFQNSEVNYKMLEAIIYQVFFTGKQYNKTAYKSIAIDALNSAAFLFMKKSFYCRSAFNKNRHFVGFEHIFNSILNPDFSSKGYGRNIKDYMELEQKDSKKYNYIDFFLKTESSIFGEFDFYKKDSFCNLRNPIENNFHLFKTEDDSNEKNENSACLEQKTPTWSYLSIDDSKEEYFENVFQYPNLNVQETWNEKHQELVKLLKSVFPDRNIEIYNLLATYITSMISILSIINFDEYFEDLYKKTNKIVIFEGSDGVGKSTLINSISKDLAYKMNKRIESSIENGKYSTVDFNYNYPKPIENPFELANGNRYSKNTNNDNLFDVKDRMNDPLNHSYNPDDIVYKINFHPNLRNSSRISDESIETSNMYKKLRPSSFLSKYGTTKLVGDINARQMVNLSNIVIVNKMNMDLTFANHKKFEYNIESSSIYSKIYGEDGNEVCKVGHKNLNYHPILLQDRSFLSTLVYSIDVDKILKEIITEANQSEYNKASKECSFYLFDIFSHVLNIKNDHSGKFIKEKKNYKFFKPLFDISSDQDKERRFIIDSADFYEYILDRWAANKEFGSTDNFNTSFEKTIQYYLNDKSSENFDLVRYWKKASDLYSEKIINHLYKKRDDKFDLQQNSLIELYSEIAASQKRSTQVNVNCGDFIDTTSFILTKDFEAGEDISDNPIENNPDFFESFKNSYCKVSITFEDERTSLAQYMIDQQFPVKFFNGKYTFIIDVKHFRNYVYKRLYNIFENFRFAAKDYTKKQIPRKVHNINMNSHWGDIRVREMLTAEVVEKIFDN